MAKAYNKGTKIQWDWGSGPAEGKVVESFTEDVTRIIKGNEVTRKASTESPAYMIEQDDGDSVLKSHSEVKKA